MSSKVQPRQIPSSSNEIMSPDIQGARTLATFLAQHGTRESLSSRDSVSRSTSHDQRDSILRHRPQEQDTARNAVSSHQNPARSSRSFVPPPPAQDAPPRYPNLSLDTRNLSHSHSHSHSSPLPTAFESPISASETPSPLHADLTSLQSSLQSLWSLSSGKLRVLHRTLAIQDDTLRSISAAREQLESSVMQQNSDVERLRAEHARAIRESQDAEEARKRALREREMLGVANARLWEDKARLEGEKRDLKVRLAAEAAATRMCEQEIENIKKKQHVGSVQVKMEEGEGDEDPDGGVAIPISEVKRVVEERLKIQADQFTREAKELYENFARTQTRVTELEAQLKGYSATTAEPTASAPTFPHTVSRVTPPSLAPSRSGTVDAGSSHGGEHGNGTNRTTVNGAGRTNGHPSPTTGGARRTPPVSPVTHNGLPFSTSEAGWEREREFPFVSAQGGQWTGRDGRRVTSTGHVESERRDSEEREEPKGRISGPILRAHSHAPHTSSEPSSYLSRLSRTTGAPSSLARSPGDGPVRDAQGQVVSSYGGVGAGWRPATMARAAAGMSHSHAHSHSQHPGPAQLRSRPPTPTDRPSKRARKADPEGVEHEGDDAMTTEIQGGQPSPLLQQPPPQPPAPRPPQPLPPPPSEVQGQPSARDMTSDERITLVSLSRVLTKKRSGDGWKCILCRQGKKSSPATFGEETPIGAVTRHVKEAHARFWRELKDGDGKAQRERP